jgi:hypothetical protein
MGNQFTKLDWKQGKKNPRRPRLRAYGGQKEAPAAFLEAAKSAGFSKGLVGLKRCKHCGRLAMTGYHVCWVHGAATSEARKGKWVPNISAEDRLKRRAEFKSRQGKAPSELLSMRIYKEADTRDKVKLIESWGKESWAKVIRLIRQSK